MAWEKKSVAAWLGAAAVALAAGGAWWWLAPQGGGPAGAGAAADAAVSGEPLPFAVLDCRARLFESSPALTLTFTQPVGRGQAFDRLVRVVDLGPAKDEDAAREDDATKPADAPATGGPRPAADAPAGEGVAGHWVVGDNPRVLTFPFARPQRQYAIVVQQEIGAQAGARLETAVRCDVATEAMPPTFYFASRGVVLPAGQNGGLPVVTVNVPEIDVQFLRLDAAQLPVFFDKVLGVGQAAARDEDADDDWRYSSNRSMQGNVSGWDLDRLKRLSRSVYLGRFTTDERRDRRNVSFLPVERIAELREPGVYLAVMNQPGSFRDDYQVTYFYVSDIGVHARRYPGQLDAYATSLRSGKAIGGVAFELLDAGGRSVAKAQADGDGRARFGGDVEAARLLLARAGSEMTVLALHQPALDLSEFDVGGHPSRSRPFFVYAGRDLYRPGETFGVSVLARDAAGRTPSAQPLTATLKRPDGRVVRTALWRPADDIPGYFRQQIALPADAQTGTWRLELRTDPAARRADADWTFQVEEFLPERMKLSLASAQQTLAPGQPLRVEAQADYLFGAPAAGNRLLGTVTVTRDRYPLAAQWPGFVFGDFADDARSSRRDLDEQTTGTRGEARLAIPVDAGGAQSPMKVEAAFSLLESGGRPVVRTIARTVWPAPALIGVRPVFQGDVARPDSLAEFEAVKVDAAGKVVPLAAASLRLFKEERTYYWRYDDQRGWNSGFTETEELVEARTLALDARVRVSLPVKWGRYRLELTDPQTGRTLRYRFHAGWDAQGADDLGNRPDRVQLRLATSPVKPGDTLKLAIQPPHDGEALITVEGDQVLWSRRMRVQASGSQVDIPLAPEWNRADLYVGVAVFRPGSEGDRVTPARALGLLHVPLDNGDRRLDVAITAPPKVQPERRVEVDVAVRGAPAGQQVYLTLSAVDAGILSITRFATPDPFDFYFGKHRYAPELLDMYGKLIEKMDGTPGRLKWGGDAGMRDSRSLPAKVRLVDLFSGPVRVDAQGRARVPLALPDFNGTLRLMATVFTEDRVGSAEADMTVAAPVVAELAMPRFISPGDAATIALDLTNLSGAAQNLSVRLQGQAPLQLRDGQRQAELADRQRTTLRFPVEASGAHGLGPLVLTVEGKGGATPVSIRREAVLQVQPAAPAEREVRRLRLAPGERAVLEPAALARFIAGSATVGVAVSNQPPLNVSRLVQGLLDYPYGCLEQTVSGAYPQLFVDEAQARELGLTPRTRAERERLLEAAIGRVAGMQKAAGGFTLWGDGAPEVWLTAYVAGFMQDAREQGFAVPDAIAARSQQWLLGQLQQAANGFATLPAPLRDWQPGTPLRDNDRMLLVNGHRRFAELAHAAYVLAREQKAPLSTLRVLHDNYRDRARSPLPLVHLSLALRLMGDEARAQAALDDAMVRPYGIGERPGATGEWLGDYGSALRDLSMSYALLRRHQVGHVRLEAWMADIGGRLAARSYLSTQEQLALYLAARAAGGRAGAAWQAELQTAAGTEKLASSASEARSLTGAQLAQGIAVVNTHAEPLFVELDIQGYPREAGPAHSAGGVTIERRWFEADGRPWNGRPLQSGDILLVRLEAAASRRIEDALIVDRVPAGFEVENMNLSQGRAADEREVGGVRVADTLSDPRICHREFRDDRFVAAARLDGKVTVFYQVRVVTPGTFVVPAPMVEDMYRPEIRAVGVAPGRISIGDPQRAPAAP